MPSVYCIIIQLFVVKVTGDWIPLGGARQILFGCAAALIPDRHSYCCDCGCRWHRCCCCWQHRYYCLTHKQQRGADAMCVGGSPPILPH